MASSDIGTVYQEEIRERGESGRVISFLTSILRPVIFQRKAVLSDDGEIKLIEFETCG